MKRKKTKIVCSIGIVIVVLALSGWLAWRFHFSWFSLTDNVPNELALNEADGSVTMNVDGWIDIVFLLDEPAYYIVSERVSMRDGMRLRNGLPYLSRRDVTVINTGMETAMAAISETCPFDPVGLIVNGLYGQGTDEQNALIHDLLGNELARDRFEVYFQWYNVIHELGHLITVHHGTYDPMDMEGNRHMIEEEQLVNSFAVAFWQYFGEEEKIYALEEMVDYVLSNITPPVDNMSHIDFMQQAIDENRMHEVFTFEIYGWFQFSIVRDKLRIRHTLNLSDLLTEMTGTSVTIHADQILAYPTLGTDVVPELVADATYVLRNFGVAVPNSYVVFNTDPNMHMLQYPISRTVIEPNINSGRVIQAWR